jgi:hypothetical protein
MHTPIYWLKPSLLRSPVTAAGPEADFFVPQILKLETDDFMDAFLAAAAAGSAPLAALMPAAPDGGKPLKLFQPAHGRFYLVCASLACRLPDFPDHTLKPEAGEAVFFVLRKSVQGTEYGWAPGEKAGHWKPVGGLEVLADEERLPLMRANAAAGRNLWFGYLPLSGRETYAVAPSRLDPPLPPEKDPRLQELQARFLRPLTNDPATFKNVVGQAATALAPETADDAAKRAIALSVYMLLDLYDFFADFLKDVADALAAAAPAPFTGDKATAKGQLLAFIQGQPTGAGLNLGAALKAVAAGEARRALDQLGDGDVRGLGFTAQYSLAAFPQGALPALGQKVRDALPAESPADLNLPKFVSASQNDAERAETAFVLRCVYQRPRCDIEYRVSRPSARFIVAAFFDGDAPARPVRIPLPSDVSIGGLRKFQKGVTFLLSESLQRKVNRIAGKEKALLKDEAIDAESGDFAFICSFSIQIIFIVAFFLLLLFVIILNLLFWWLPFFRICLPVPKKLFSS